MPITDETYVLDIQNVSKYFGAVKAVDEVTIQVRQGEVFGFLGPNGAGKSTTIRLLLDILRPDSGTITILGASSRWAAHIHQDIGYLSGDMALDNDLTGRQYLELVNSLHGGAYRSEIDRLSVLLEVSLDTPIGNYSRGNRQKIGLIAALLHQPKLLVLDEPTSGFDPLVQETFNQLIRDYAASGGTVFMSSHILAEVQHLCDRVAFIRSGKIVATKSVAELLDTTAKRIHLSAPPELIKHLLHDYQKVHGLQLLTRDSRSLDLAYQGPIKPLLRFLQSTDITDITIREPELDEIFGQYYVDTAEDEPSDA